MLVADVGAIAGVITAVALLVTSLGVLRPMHRTVEKTERLVNQQRTDLVNYQRALVHALQLAGIDVPLDQSIEQPPVTAQETP